MKPLVAAIALCAVALAQTTESDQTEGRPKYQRAFTDLVPASFITVLDKFHRPITNNYVPPSPSKQSKLTKEQILAKFTTKKPTTTTTTTTRAPSTFVTSIPSTKSTEAVTDPPYRIIFIQTTESPVSVDTIEPTIPPYFTKVVTQTAKTVSVIEDGTEKVETSPYFPTTTRAPDGNFKPVFIYKNQRFTSQSPKSVVSVSRTVTTSDGESYTSNLKAQTQSIQSGTSTTAENSQTTKASTLATTAPSSSGSKKATSPRPNTTPRPRRKVIKLKSRKAKKEDLKEEKEPVTEATVIKETKVNTQTATEKPQKAEKAEKTTKGLNRRINRTKPTEKPPATTEATSEAPVKARRPGLRRLAIGASAANKLSKDTEKQTSSTVTTPANTTPTPFKPIFRTRVALVTTKFPRPASTPSPSTTSPVASTSTPLFTSSRTSPVATSSRTSPAVTSSRTSPAATSTRTSPVATSSRTSPVATTLRRLPATTTQAQTTVGVTTRLTTTRTTESPLSSPSPTTTTEVKTTPRITSRRVVTRIGTTRAPTTYAYTTPIPEGTESFTTESFTDGFTSSAAKKKVLKRKRKPATKSFDLTTQERLPVTPNSVVYFQTTSVTTPIPPSTVDASHRRVVKRRRKRPGSDFDSDLHRPLFTITEAPIPFNAPIAITGFRPITSPPPTAATNYYGSPDLSKSDEISQVINLPGGRLSSYNTRYIPKPTSETQDYSTIPQRQFVSAYSPTSNPSTVSRLPPSQRGIRPGPFSPQSIDYFGNDPSYGDFQRLLIDQNNRFTNQPRSHHQPTSYNGYNSPVVY